ncbi:MAG: gliding motility protein GldL [Muribaculaceae bacterium]|nr:gliding motility protein GldL [Muribaculaceae bacterium]
MSKNQITKFLSGDTGQRFFNFAYSIGAAVVIWGALFKILHLQGGNTLLSIGMGTEVLMFLLTAFDRPEKQYKWEKVFPVLDSDNPEDQDQVEINGSFGGGGGTVIIGGGSGEGGEYTGDGMAAAMTVSGAQAKGAVGLGAAVDLSPEDTLSLSESIAKMAAASDQLSRMAELTDATQQYLSQMAGISEQMERLASTTTALNQVSETLLQSYRAITDNSGGISESSTGYVQQMDALNRNISGLNTIYEIQLKSISSQLDSIDRVNRSMKDIRDMYEKSAAESAHYCDETEKMARYMKQLNSVYEKMIKAMTVNMYRPMTGMPGMEPDNANNDEN